MAMGKKPPARPGSPLWVTTADLPTSAGHPVDPKLVRAFVRRVRGKLGDAAAEPVYILTERGVGYRMATPPDR